MPALTALFEFGLQQVLDLAGPWTVDLLKKHFVDHGQALPKAIARANDRAWQSLSIALAGDSFVAQVKTFFASGDKKGIAAQIKEFVDSNAASVQGATPEDRKMCLAELKKAKQAGLLSVENLVAEDCVSQHSSFTKYTDAQGLIDGAKFAVGRVADGLAGDYPNLARLLRMPTPDGPPLLAVAFSFFFSREIETNEDLSRRLTHDGLQRLHASQAVAFERVFVALHNLGGQFEVIFEQLDRIEVVVGETNVRVQEIDKKLDRLLEDNRIRQGPVKPQDGISIRTPQERQLVKELLVQFRELPPEQQHQFPDTLRKIGTLQYGSGDFAGAMDTFEEVAQFSTQDSAKAEAHYNAYRAALEKKAWEIAFDEICAAAELDKNNYEPFPFRKYKPKKILGAGGFGTVFLVHALLMQRDVVIKTLHPAQLQRSVNEVFGEAHALSDLNHDSIIKAQHCDYANDDDNRPYIVMDYFDGMSLQQHLDEHGCLEVPDLVAIAQQIASGMSRAHNQNILHRDLKPDNILVRKDGERWQVKVIDFGLAMKQETIETSLANRTSGRTILNESIAGTIKYAPPEQMDMDNTVPVKEYSDIFSFGKLCI